MVTSTMPKQGMMMGTMKGHLAPNSSPFKPTINKLTSQYLIQDHMSSHYMKLGTTRAAIDNKPPRSMATSVKKRDQMKREAMTKQMKLFDFEKEMKHGSTSALRHTPDSSLYGSQQRLFSVTVSKTGYDEPRPQSMSSFRSGRMSPRARSALSPRSSTRSELNSPRDKPKKPDILSQTYSGDYLDRHEERFKNVDTPFTPRLKKRSAKSYLSQSKHYAPPLTVRKETKRKTALKFEKTNLDEMSPTSSASDLQAQERAMSSEANRTLDETKLMKHPTDSAKRLSFSESSLTYDNIYPERQGYDDYGFRHSPMNDTFLGRSSLGRSFSRTDTFANGTKNRIEAEEEEMKYLEFINSVTNDILTRGVYSDRVLTQVMQRHLDQNRGRLNEGRMRHMLMKLQEDLGVPSQITTQRFATAPRYASSYDGSIAAESEHRSERKRGSEYQSPQSKRSWQDKLPKKDRRSDSALSNSSDGKSKKKGILKTPATSSGSELDLKSVTLSSGEDEDKSKSKNVMVGNKSGGTKKQSEVMELINGLDLNEDSRNKEESEEIPIYPPKPAKRTSVGAKLKSEPHSLDGGTEKPAGQVLEAKQDQKDEDFGFGSDLDDF